MITISVCMIVKNEEDVLERCLLCTSKFADELIIVDTGSSDGTKQIAGKFTGQIYDFPWIEDFSAARNFSFSKATMDYCMWLDADDIIDDSNIQKLVELKETLNPRTDVVKMKYIAGFDQDGNVTFSYYRERLMRRESNFQWAGAVHEAIAARGNIIHSDIAIIHKKKHAEDPDRNLRIYEHQIQLGQSLCPRDQFYYARELFYHDKTADAIQILEAFIREKQGWIENSIEACSLLSKCYLKEKEDRLALRSLLISLEFDAPRAEICCEIGDYFYRSSDYITAIFWYETAAGRARKDTAGGFVLPDCYDYYPFIQLCVCYDRLGDYEAAINYNEKAGRIKPNSPAYLQNNHYFFSQQRY